MTDEELKAIEGRLNTLPSWSPVYDVMRIGEVRALIAEVRRLREEEGEPRPAGLPHESYEVWVKRMQSERYVIGRTMKRS